MGLFDKRKERKAEQQAEFESLLEAARSHQLQYTYSDKDLIEGFNHRTPFQVNKQTKMIRLGSMSDKNSFRLSGRQLTEFFTIAEDSIALASEKARLHERIRNSGGQ